VLAVWSAPMSTPAPVPGPLAAAPYREEDKLGPLGARRSVLIPGQADVRAAMVAGFRAEIDRIAAIAAAVEPATVDADVHAMRKALRWARGILSLAASALPPSEHRAIRRELRAARRALSVARDHAVAPVRLHALELPADLIGTRDRVAAAAAAAAPEVEAVIAAVRAGAARAGRQLVALEAALPAQLTWAIVAAGVAATYRDARRALAASKRSRRAFHAWRRRCKELAHQLEFVADLAGPEVAALRAPYQELSDHLGDVVDTLMLRDFVATHGDGARPGAVPSSPSCGDQRRPALPGPGDHGRLPGSRRRTTSTPPTTSRRRGQVRVQVAVGLPGEVREAGLTALLGCGFDPGVTNVYCAWAQKHHFDEIDTSTSSTATPASHGKAFATNFNPEINIREITATRQVTGRAARGRRPIRCRSQRMLRLPDGIGPRRST
jgi:CHAD domain-containing protein